MRFHFRIHRLIIALLALLTLGTAAASADVGPSIAPSEPTNVQATDGEYAHKVKITWNASPGATYYQLWRAQTWGNSAWMHNATTTHTYDTVALTGAPGPTCWYLVKACNPTSCSGMVNSVDTGFASYTLPPEGVSATDGTYHDKVRITWSPADYAYDYRVYRGTSLWTGWDTVLSEEVTNTYYDDTTASYNTDYYYWVKSCNKDECSNLSDWNRGERLSPPDWLHASDDTYSDKVDVDWPTCTGATYYRLYRGTNSQGWSTEWPYITASEYDDSSAVPGTTYYYWVKSCNSSGCTGFSVGDQGRRSVATATKSLTPTGTSTSTPTKTPTPTWTSVSVATRTATATERPPTRTPTATWTPRSTYTPTSTNTPFGRLSATPSRTPRTTSTPTATVTKGGLITATPTWTGAPPDTRTPTPTGTWLTHPTATPTATEKASSTPTPTATRTPKPTFTPTETNAPGDPPPPPANLRASDGRYRDKIQVAWDTSQGATSYKVFRALTAAGAGTELARTGNTTCDDLTVWDSITYYYWAQACNASGCSDRSDPDNGYRGSSPRPATQTHLPMILRAPKP